MLSTYFTKQTFMNACKNNSDFVVFLSSTVALMLMIVLHGLIQSNLQPAYFMYAILVSGIFYIWTIIDQKYRK